MKTVFSVIGAAVVVGLGVLGVKKFKSRKA